MPEWSTYGLSDFLMFSARTWYRTLALHNETWFPLHFATTGAAAVLLLSLLGRARWIGTGALVLAGLSWLLVAAAFHAARYAPINWAATYFAIAFAAEGVLLLVLVLPTRHRLAPVPVHTGGAGPFALVAMALLYPIVAVVCGRPFTQSEWFALMPDPTVLATLGLLLALRGPQGAPRRRTIWLALMPVPLLWCLITGATLWTLKAPEWFLMPLAGMAALAMGWRRRGKVPFAPDP